jgi:hypothetical protein
MMLLSSPRCARQVANGVADMGAVEMQAPATFEVNYTAVEDVTLVMDAAGGVLGGATVPPLSVKLTKGPSHGSLDFESDGSFNYTPSLNFGGTDSFDFEAFDSNGGKASGTTSIAVGELQLRGTWKGG